MKKTKHHRNNNNNKSISQHKVAVAARKAPTTAKHKIVGAAAVPHDSSSALHHDIPIASVVAAAAAFGGGATEVIDLTSDNEEPLVATVRREKSILVDLHKHKTHKQQGQHPLTTTTVLDNRRQCNVSAAGSLYEKASSRHARHRCALVRHASRKAAIPLRKSSAVRKRPTVPEYTWQDDVPLVPKVHKGIMTAHTRATTIRNNRNVRMTVSHAESYEPLMVGQVLPRQPTTTTRQRRGSGTTITTSHKSRQRLSEKLWKKRNTSHGHERGRNFYFCLFVAFLVDRAGCTCTHTHL